MMRPAAAAMALAALSGCAPEPVVDTLPFACRVPLPPASVGPGMPELLPQALVEQMPHENYWNLVITHGSDAELAALIREARNRQDVRVPARFVRRAEAALVWRAQSGCADIPDNSTI